MIILKIMTSNPQWKKYRRKQIVEASQIMNSEVIHTLEGPKLANAGDMVIKGKKGGLYLVRLDLFSLTYELIEEDEKF